jgi:hypothetical protein
MDCVFEARGGFPANRNKCDEKTSGPATVTLSGLIAVLSH